MYCSGCGKKLPDKARYCPMCGACVELPTASTAPTLPVRTSPTGASEASTPTAPGFTELQKPRHGGRNLFLSLLMYVLMFAFEVLGAIVAMLLDADMDLFITVGAAVGVVLGLIIMTGTSLLRWSLSSIAQAFRQSWWLIAVNMGMFVFDIVYGMAAGEVYVEPGWALRTISLIILCLCIGLCEEGLFRGLILHGLLGVMGRNRRGIVCAVVITSAVFGAAHIDWVTIDYGDMLSVAQAVMKVLQTGIFGYFLAAVILQTGDIVGAALVHAFGDFVLMVCWVGLMAQPTTTEYVSTGEDALETLMVYVVVCALYAPLVVKAHRMLRRVPEPNYGAFQCL